tara:strand:- start:187 stop:1503 length:1317 start_codon:yes stop_codon:yes gene_type:complete
MFSWIVLTFKDFFFDRSLSLDVIFFSALLIFLPVALITGPALPDIFLSLIGLYFLIKSITEKNFYYYKNLIFLGFTLFSLYGIVRSLFTDIAMDSLTNEGSVFFFRYIFFVFGVAYLLNKNKHIIKCLIIVLVLCLILVSFDALTQYIYGKNLIGTSKFNSLRLTGLFGDMLVLGKYLGFISIFAFSLIYQNYKKTKKIIFFLYMLLVIPTSIIFLSGERVSFFYSILFIVLVHIYIPAFKITNLLLILPTIFILIFGFHQFNTDAKKRMIDLTLEQTSKTKYSFLPYSDHHEEHYISALKMFIDNKIFGIGTNTFRFHCYKKEYLYKERSCSTHPHNYYLQILAELGIVGFVFIIILYFYLSFIGLRQTFYVLKNNRKELISPDKFLYILILLIYLWPLIPHVSLYNNWNNVLLTFPVGFVIAHLIRNKNNGFFIKT